MAESPVPGVCILFTPVGMDSRHIDHSANDAEGIIVSDKPTPSCLWPVQIASWQHDPPKKARKDQVAEAGFPTSEKRAERGRVLPWAWAVCSAFFCLEETAGAGGGQEVRRSESGAHGGCVGSGSRPGHRDWSGGWALSSGAARFRCGTPAGGAGGVGAAVMIGLPSLHTLDQAQAVRIWWATEKADMRCGFDRLAERVKTVLGEDPLSGHLFVFRSRRGDRLKILLWDGDGFVLWYKRLEEGVFKLPRTEEGQRSVELRASELAMVLDGIDMTKLKRVPRYSRAVEAGRTKKGNGKNEERIAV